MTDAGTTGQRPPGGDDPGWTPRQRQVLDLLVLGRTNAEIAAELGVSLDGAKWHLREILAKLGVDTREEAADYWRRRNRMPARLRRVWAALGALGAGRTARIAAGIAGFAAVAIVVALVVAALRGGDSPTPGAPLSPSPAPPSPTPTGTPPTGTATATATAVAGGGVIGTYDGLPVYELVPAGPEPLPAGSVLYFSETCGVCIDAPLIRLRQDAGGAWVREPLLTGNDPGLPPGYPLSMVAGPGGRFAATWCIVGERGCGKTHSEVPDTTPRGVVVSEDGGVTWRLVAGGPLEPSASVVSFAGDQLIVAHATPDGAGVPELREYPSGRVVSMPAPGGAPALLPGYELRSAHLESLALSNEGDVLFALVPAGAQPAAYATFPGGTLSVGAALSPTGLLGWAERNPKAYLVSPPRDLGGFDRLPVLVDLERHTIAPLADLHPEVEFDVVQPVGWLAGPVVAVAGAGDCLYVRAEPDQASAPLGCYADRVLFGDRGDAREAGGRTWRAVTTPDGRPGWAAADFLAE